MIYLRLFMSFFKIGLFSFGGGYAMIPLISDLITKEGWLLQEEFVQIIGIAEMTPGPIAVNSATFVGYKTAGILGSMSATLGVAMPSLLLILFVSGFFFKYSDHPIMKHIFLGIRPVVAGLILASALVMARTTILSGGHGQIAFNFETFIITIVILFIALRQKMHPIILISIAGILGYFTTFL
ncbi:chromate transporter [Acidaminobacter sp. JC074]|uniref:chromate transporter n=1 Tax=Acidaminobacter sp. JC074 TaxID=2530199 RepID=UPI001F0E8B26|nr:chromate transporter [Acidaminobacter sp. JC074]MCH4886612.1 chromate transporter [Acidaminobacter sp. JC074]